MSMTIIMIFVSIAYSPFALALAFAEESVSVSSATVIVSVVSFLSLVLNGVQFYHGRRKTESEISNMDAHTRQIWVDSLDKIQKSNNELYSNLVLVRAKAEQVEDQLEETQALLEDCNADCSDCESVIKQAIASLTGSAGVVETLLSGVTDADEHLVDFKSAVQLLQRQTQTKQRESKTEDGE